MPLQGNKHLLDKARVSQYLLIECDDAARFARRQLVRAALMRDPVADFVGLPRKVDRIEIRAIDAAHFVRHRLSFVAQGVEKLVQHNVSLENRQAP